MPDIPKKIRVNQYSHCPLEYGTKQWELLSKLIVKYNKMDISQITSSNFDDNIWHPPAGEKFSSSITFGSIANYEFAEPYIVFLKIFTVVCVKELRNAYTTAQSRTSILINVFPRLLFSLPTPILFAKNNSPWIPLSELGIQDLYILIQKASGGKKPTNFCSALALIEKTQYHEDLLIFSSGFITPWSYERMSFTTWVDAFAASENIEHIRKPYSPLSDETVSNMVKYACKFIDGIATESEDGINLSTEDDYISSIQVLKTIRKLRNRHAPGKNYTNLSAHISHDIIFQELIEKHAYFLKDIKHDPKEFLTKRKSDWYNNNISGRWFTELFELSQKAAIWIVLLSTGLRNVDLRNLKKDCLIYSKIYQAWFLKCFIKKTRKLIYIPIGEPCVRAIKLLNLLDWSYSSEFLVQNRLFSFQNDPFQEDDNACLTGTTINLRLKRLANKLNIKLETINDEEGTCHCVRATLAGFIGRNSNLAVLILKRLFGHSNMLMPDYYIRHNIFVKKQREQQLEKMLSDTAHKIAKSIVNKEVAGNKGDELLEGASHLELKIRLENESLTEMDIHKKLTEVLREVILNDIKNEQTHTLLTPMGVICMRATNQSTDSPCAANINKAERDTAGVTRTMFSVLPQLPNPAQCIGLDCSDALATKPHSLPLLEQFDWYTNVYRQFTDNNRDMDEDAKHFVNTYYPIVMANDLLTEAESFRKKYSAILLKLYADIKPDGYFNV